MSSHARDRGERRERGERRGAGPIGFRIGVALPDDADLEAFRADPPGPQVAQSRLGREIGDGGRNRVEPRVEGVGQAADRDLRVERLPIRRPVDESRRGLRRQQPAKPRRTDEGHIHASRGHQREIAKELDRIAKAVIVHHQHALGAMSRSPPRLKARSKGLGQRLSLKPARFVSLKPAFEVAERQHEAAPAGDSLAAAQRRGGVERFQSLRETAEAPQRQRLPQQRLGQARPCRVRLEIRLKRLLAAIELEQPIAEIDRSLRKIMPQRERALRRFDRFFEPSKLAQSSGQAAPGVRIVRSERCRRGERGERLGELASGEQKLAEIDMGDGERRVELERAAVEAHRRVRLAGFAQHVSAHGESGGGIGPETQRLVDQPDRFIAPALAP